MMPLWSQKTFYRMYFILESFEGYSQKKCRKFPFCFFFLLRLELKRGAKGRNSSMDHCPRKIDIGFLQTTPPTDQKSTGRHTTLDKIPWFFCSKTCLPKNPQLSKMTLCKTFLRFSPSLYCKAR